MRIVGIAITVLLVLTGITPSGTGKAEKLAEKAVGKAAGPPDETPS